MSELILWVSELVLCVSELILWVPEPIPNLGAATKTHFFVALVRAVQDRPPQGDGSERFHVKGKFS